MCKPSVNHCVLNDLKPAYDYRKQNYQMFRELLYYNDWNALYNKLDEGYTQKIYNSDDLYNIFANEYTTLYDKAFKKKKCKMISQLKR